MTKEQIIENLQRYGLKSGESMECALHRSKTLRILI